MDKARLGATYQDLLDVPENMVAEILDGEVIATPRPASPHALAASAAGRDLFGRFHRPPNGPEQPGGWWILFEPELYLGPDVIVPDVAGWRREKMPVREKLFDNSDSFCRSRHLIPSPILSRRERIRGCSTFGAKPS